MIFHYLKRFSLFAFIFSCVFFSIPPASAVTSSAYTSCYPQWSAPTGLYEPYLNWVKRVDSTCKTKAVSPKLSYLWFLHVKQELDIAQRSSDFSIRFAACAPKSSTFSILDPVHNTKWLACWIKVVAYPTSSVLRNKIADLGTSIAANQPFSFAKIAIQTVGGVAKNWGTIECEGSGALNWQVKAGVANMNFNIPCQPPSPLRKLRAFAVAALCIGFLFNIWSIAQAFLKELNK